MRIAVRINGLGSEQRRTIVSRVLVIGLLTLLGGVAALQHPTSAAAFPFETFRWGWGENNKGELGNLSDQNPDRPLLSSALPAGTQLTRLAAGSNAPLLGSHSLAVDRNQNVWAWGFNIYGQVGSGASPSAFAPVKVCATQTNPCDRFLRDITAVAAGGLHSLAVDIQSNVWAWGNNDSGQLGSNVGNTAVPVRNNALFAQLHQLPGPPSVTAIAAGAHHSLALDSRGAVWAWGARESGQLGRGNDPTAGVIAIQIVFPEPAVITAITAGAYFSLALDNGGNVWAWGANDSGQLGISSFDARRTTPVKLTFFPPNTRITAIAGGGNHALALDSGGKVWAWGANAAGQLGNAQNIEQRSPTSSIFPAGTRIVRISAGGGFNLAVDADRNAWAWGANGSGQLGNQQRFVNSNVPVRVAFPAGTRITTVAAGGFHSLALETRSFLDGLEAVLDFDLTAQPRLLPQALDPDEPIQVATTSTNLDPAGNKQLLTHTLTDTAANTFVLTLTQQRIGKDGLALEVTSVRYNDGALLTPAPNRNEFHWKTDASGRIVLLQQHVFLNTADGVTNITAHFDAAKNETTIDVKTPTERPQQFTESGLVTVQMATINGKLRFSDGTRIWP
jgi:alpha-tubulin suppressor-like RCC1 family protein